MGSVLKSRYEQIGRELGSIGRMKLAMLTKISSIRAAEIEDSAENIKAIDAAIEELHKEH